MQFEQYFLTHGNSVSLNDVIQFQDKLEIKLPYEYVEFLCKVNGGEPSNEFFDLRAFDPQKTNVNTYVIIDAFFDYAKLPQVWNYVKEDLIIEGLFPIADVRGGMVLCCNLGDTLTAGTYLYDYNFGVLRLTDSLNDFLNC